MARSGIAVQINAAGGVEHAVKLDETPSNCAFGGPDMDLLFVTARTTVYVVRLGVKGATP